MQESSTVGWIAFWWVAFAGSHMLLSSSFVRPSLTARFGERGFAGVYSLVAFATFVPLVSVYWGSRHAGTLLWSLAGVPGTRVVALVLGVAAFALLVTSFVQPSPAGMDARAALEPRGVTRITRHPMLVAFVLWSLAHLLVNGFATDVAFFGGMAVYSVIGAMHQDTRKRAARAGELDVFYRETSLVPFAAIVTGRGRLVLSELPWIALAAGGLAGYGVYLLHPTFFG